MNLLRGTYLSKSLLHSVLQIYPANWRQKPQYLSQGHNKTKSMISDAQILI